VINTGTLSANVSPSSWTMDVGQNETFTATASFGSGTYSSYQWYVNGSAQSSQTNSTFSFAPTSAGSYAITVTVTDSSGVTSTQSTVAVATVRQVFSSVLWLIVVIVIITVLFLTLLSWYRHHKKTQAIQIAGVKVLSLALFCYFPFSDQDFEHNSSAWK